MSRIEIYDTTLRDGSQSEDISLSLDDKITIVTRLDQLGLHYIEAGWPGANPKDERLFAKIKSLPIKNARIMAFGSTCKPGAHPEHDRLLRSIINAKPYGVTIFGKSWDTHVKGVGGLGCTLDENLRMISDTIAYLKGFFPAVFLTPSTSSTGSRPTGTMRSLPSGPLVTVVPTGSCCVIRTGERCLRRSGIS